MFHDCTIPKAARSEALPSMEEVVDKICCKITPAAESQVGA